MKARHTLILTSSAVLLAAFISACDREGPAEQAGEKIDDAVQTTGERIEEVGDSAAEATNRAGERIGETVEETRQRMDEAGESAAESVERAGDEVESATDR
jgi:phage-related minor tail protein